MAIEDWLDNEPKVTGACAGASAVCLVLSLAGVSATWPVDVAWAAIVLCGAPILVGAVVGLMRDHDVTADVLVSMALVASVYAGEWFAAGEVALIMQIGSLLEDYTANRARKGIESLVELTPRTARVVRDGEESVVPVEQIVEGDILRVHAGETIPVDGLLTLGSTTVDQSIMTGESLPVDKVKGDELVSGTVSRTGAFEMRATKPAGDSSLQRMVALAEAADANKAPVVRLADRWAGWLVGVALACAIAVWAATGEFIRGVTVLVVFCPCAFVLATPTAVAAAIGNLTKYGVLVRTGNALQRLAEADAVAFDKTGTLTHGRPRVVGVESLSGDATTEQLASLAASAESRSEHPLGKAIVAWCKERGIPFEPAATAEVRAGLGIVAEVGGSDVEVGKPAMLGIMGVDRAAVDASAAHYLEKGATVVCVVANGKLCGIVALADTVRSEAPRAVARLKEMGVEPVLLTGDNAQAAGTIAASVGIGEVCSDMAPEGKAEAVSEMGGIGRRVCMVGDGVNDALALRAAHAGVAMGGIGSDVAVESADAVLVSDDIERVPYLLHVARRSMHKVRQNIGASLVINFSAILLSAFGVLDPVTGALWHNFGSVFVVVNAALLLREQDRG